MRFFEKFGVRVEERGGGIETPDELAGYGGEMEFREVLRLIHWI